MPPDEEESGNEPSKIIRQKGTNTERSVSVSLQVHAALVQTGLADRVKLVTPLEMSILGCSYPPSAGIVSETHLAVVTEVVRFLVRIGSPFCINVYPFFARQHASQDFILFGPDPGYSDGEGGCRRYTDMFSAQYDAVVAGLSKLDVVGAAGLDVVVTEVGWPSGELTAAAMPEACVEASRS